MKILLKNLVLMTIPEEVLWRQRLENWDKHFECVLLLTKLLLKQKELIVQHTLRVNVFNEDPEALAVTMHLGKVFLLYICCLSTSYLSTLKTLARWIFGYVI